MLKFNEWVDNNQFNFHMEIIIRTDYKEIKLSICVTNNKFILWYILPGFTSSVKKVAGQVKITHTTALNVFITRVFIRDGMGCCRVMVQVKWWPDIYSITTREHSNLLSSFWIFMGCSLEK